MRLPGTINVPNEKKRHKGRQPALARVVDELTDWSRQYVLEEFSEVLIADGQTALSPTIEVPDVSVEALPPSVHSHTRHLILSGDDPERPIGSKDARYKSRSEVVWRVACDLARAECSDEVIAGILLNPAHGISASIREKPKPKAHALRQVARARAAISVGWPDVTQKGIPRATLRNTLFAIWRLELYCEYDEFHRRKSVSGVQLQEYHGELTDDACAVLRYGILQKFGFDPGKDHTREAVNTLCFENTYHPVRNYLHSLDWDRVPRLDNWLSVYLGAEDTPLNRAVGRILMLAAVRRVRQPGVKYDNIIVLEGPQGSGKSTAILILAGAENFSDQDILTLDAKAQMEALEGVWLYEICELEGLSRAETNKVKAFASRSVDRARPAYGRFRENRPRQCVFIGTTNDDHYLRDLTGNRRFWPIRTSKIDLEALRRDRDQLWAEAAYWEAKDESLTLAEDLWPAAQREQEARLEDDPWLEVLMKVEGKRMGEFQRIDSHTLLTNDLGIPPERQQQYHTKRLALLMRKLGWNGPGNVKMGDGRVVRGYQRLIRKIKDD